MSKKKLIFVVNVDWFFLSHRLLIAEEAIKNGFDVYLVTENTGCQKEIESKGIKFINLKISRSGKNPFIEIRTLINLFKIYVNIKPNIVHHVTLKPVIYGSLVAKLLKIDSVINAISGLGYIFINRKNSVTKFLMIQIMKFGFYNEKLSIIFQNNDDKIELTKHNIINDFNSIYIIKGSGVNLTDFNCPEFPDFSKIKILFPTRMLWDKGVKELREATEILKKKYYSRIEFILSGMIDVENKAGVSIDYLKSWEDGSYVKWIGHNKNMIPIYQESHIVILPSYREGLPKSLIEACAIGRAIITTNAIGCKDCVDEGINGYKVSIGSSLELSEAVEKLINSKDDIIRMGRASRQKALLEFSIDNVVKKHLDIYKNLD